MVYCFNRLKDIELKYEVIPQICLQYYIILRTDTVSPLQLVVVIKGILTVLVLVPYRMSNLFSVQYQLMYIYTIGGFLMVSYILFSFLTILAYAAILEPLVTIYLAVVCVLFIMSFVILASKLTNDIEACRARSGNYKK